MSKASRSQTTTSLRLAQSTIKVLHTTQSLSAATFSTFLVLHLTAPLAAIAAPSGKAESWASGFMVLGRVWYMGEWSEGVVVWGSLAVHVTSGVTKRLLKAWERKERRRLRRSGLREMVEKAGVETELIDLELGDKSSTTGGEKDEEEIGGLFKGEKESEEVIEVKEIEAVPVISFLGPLTLHHITGYILIPFALHHSWLHRLLPSTPSAPISGLSPTLFSYAFVSYSLTSETYRLISLISYGAIASLGTYHVLSGIRRLSDPMAPPGLQPKRLKNGEPSFRKRSWQGVYAGGLLGLGIGVARLASEGKSVPAWLGRKYDVILRQGFAY